MAERAVRRVASNTFIVSLPRDVPYLGPLGPGEAINAKGYFVRRGNRTIYPSTDMSVIVKVTARDGTVGWGETYGIVAPRAVIAIIDDVLGPMRRRAAIRATPSSSSEDLYDLMRVRGFHRRAIYVDALAGVDIALWDLVRRSSRAAAVRSCSAASAPTAFRRTCPACRGRRSTSAWRWRADWSRKGFDAVKYAAAVSYEGIVAEMRALREALGPDVKLMVDLHWKFTAAEAIAVDRRAGARIGRTSPRRLARRRTSRARASRGALACADRRWRGMAHRLRGAAAPGAPRVTVLPARDGPYRRHRSSSRSAGWRSRFTRQVIPHASIGVGIFQAASLHAAAALPNVPYHEYQPSIFDQNLRYVNDDDALRGRVLPRCRTVRVSASSRNRSCGITWSEGSASMC